MQRCFHAARAVLIVLLPAVAAAQTPVTTVALGDPDPPGWDAAGHLAWLTVNKTGVAPEWDRWYDVATAGAAVGRFVGRHLRLEFDVATSASANIYVEQSVVIPPQTFPTYIAQPERFRMTTVSGGAAYQFFDNEWMHPFVGGGVESAGETRVVGNVFYPQPLPPSAHVDPPGTSTTWRHRPFADAGFKWFVSERGFIRSDVRTTFDRGGLAQVSWRTGFGVEF